MKGLKLSEKYYKEFGERMLKEKFPNLEKLIAVGLVGSGSECFGFDDEISQDHDFEPGFCIFLPDENTVDRAAAFALERAYSDLPKEYMNCKKSPLTLTGENRRGIIRLSDFLMSKTGTPDGRLELKDWFFIPEQSLAELTNGKLFKDDTGIFTHIRNELTYFPKDVRLKKLAGHLLLMGQSGQYNYLRCIKRRDTAAAQMCLYEFVKSAISVIFLINRQYMPYYKWSFCALRRLPMLSELAETLEYLISNGNQGDESVKKSDAIEKICSSVSKILINEGLSQFKGCEAETLAYHINDKIQNSEIRNLHILYAV